jgi:hypothetical protein
MNKPKALQISIPVPCKKGWDNMTDAGTGRHCDSCNKIVTDFTTYTDRELADFFLKAKGNVCGHVNMHQLNRAILIHENTKRSFFYKIFFGTALATWLGFASSALAQSSPSTHTQKLNTQLADKTTHPYEGYILKPIEAKVLPPQSNHYDSKLNIRGDRADATEYIVDGMIVSGPYDASIGIPTDTIDEVTVITGGIPAEFDGDGDDIGDSYSTPNSNPINPKIKR